MNIGPISIVRNTKPTLLSTSKISVPINLENPKILLPLANPIQNPERPLIYCFTFIA
jgi:hypothetical protein